MGRPKNETDRFGGWLKARGIPSSTGYKVLNREREKRGESLHRADISKAGGIEMEGLDIEDGTVKPSGRNRRGVGRAG